MCFERFIIFFSGSLLCFVLSMGSLFLCLFLSSSPNLLLKILQQMICYHHFLNINQYIEISIYQRSLSIIILFMMHGQYTYLTDVQRNTQSQASNPASTQFHTTTNPHPQVTRISLNSSSQSQNPAMPTQTYSQYGHLLR